MDAPRPKAHLRNLEAPPLTEQDILARHADIFEAHVHMAIGRMVGAEDAHGPEHLHAGRVHGHQYLRMLALARGLGVGLDHADQDLAARVAGAADEIFLAVDDPVVAVEHSTGFEVAGIG